MENKAVQVYVFPAPTHCPQPHIVRIETRDICKHVEFFFALATVAI